MKNVTTASTQMEKWKNQLIKLLSAKTALAGIPVQSRSEPAQMSVINVPRAPQAGQTL